MAGSFFLGVFFPSYCILGSRNETDRISFLSTSIFGSHCPRHQSEEGCCHYSDPLKDRGGEKGIESEVVAMGGDRHPLPATTAFLVL